MKLLGVRKRPKGRQQAFALVRSSEKPIEQRPIDLEIGGVHLRFDKGTWQSEGVVTDRKLALKALALETELTELKDNFRRLYDEQVRAKESRNLLDFKFQLLIDMWTMRVLDSDREEFSQELEKSGKSDNLLLQAESASKLDPDIGAKEIHKQVQVSESEDVVTNMSHSQSIYSEGEASVSIGKEREEVMQPGWRSNSEYTLCFTNTIDEAVFENQGHNNSSGSSHHKDIEAHVDKDFPATMTDMAEGGEFPYRIDRGVKKSAFYELDDIEYSDNSFEEQLSIEEMKEDYAH